jgi:alpha-amylase
MHPQTNTPWVAVVALPQGGRTPAHNQYIGDGHEVILQGFHWSSHSGAFDPATRTRKSWYRILRENTATIKTAGFDWVWFPPPSDSLAPQGYIPRRWNVLNTAFGNEEELRTAIRALEPVKALADMVLNHRVGVATGGADFDDPPFPDNRAAVTRDDESGIGTGNPDTGERHPAGRDLDHTNPAVRSAVKNYLHWLRSVGFRGWRYDLCKGYDGRFVGEYNEASGPEFSVGEFFDGDRQRITNWVNATGGKSTAFDFPTRFLLYDAFQRDDYHGLRSVNGGRVVPGGLIGFWPSRSVTFVDNHDTEYRREHDHYQYDCPRHFPGRTVELAYAYTLTHPGIPCVFWSHFFDWDAATRRRLERLIQIRKAAGVHSRSHVEIREARKGLYTAFIDGKVAMKLGSSDWAPGYGWQLACDGDKFAVWMR